VEQEPEHQHTGAMAAAISAAQAYERWQQLGQAGSPSNGQTRGVAGGDAPGAGVGGAPVGGGEDEDGQDAFARALASIMCSSSAAAPASASAGYDDDNLPSALTSSLPPAAAGVVGVVPATTTTKAKSDRGKSRDLLQRAMAIQAGSRSRSRPSTGRDTAAAQGGPVQGSEDEEEDEDEDELEPSYWTQDAAPTSLASDVGGAQPLHDGLDGGGGASPSAAAADLLAPTSSSGAIAAPAPAPVVPEPEKQDRRHAGSSDTEADGDALFGGEEDDDE